MAALAPIPAANNPPIAAARIAAFMRDFSVEATRPSDADIAALAGVLPRGGRVCVSAVPHYPVDDSIDAAVRLRAVDFEPVPHIAVRNFANAAALDDFLARLHGEADVAARWSLPATASNAGRSAARSTPSTPASSVGAVFAVLASPDIRKAIRASATMSFFARS